MNIETLAKKSKVEIGFSCLPSNLKDAIVGEKERYQKTDKRFWVTELIRCLRASWIDRKFTIPFSETTYYYFWRGNLLHKKMEEYLDATEERVIHQFDGVTISGKFDAKDKDTILEYKTTSSLYYAKKRPNLTHVLEAATYAAITDAKQIKIISLDFSGTKLNKQKEFFLSHTIKLTKKEKKEILKFMEHRAKALDTWLEKDELPPKSPVEPGECNYCSLRNFCHDDSFDYQAFFDEK